MQEIPSKLERGGWKRWPSSGVTEAYSDTKLIYTAITAINKLAPATAAARLQQHGNQVPLAVSPLSAFFSYINKQMLRPR